MEESKKVDGFDKPRVVDNRGTNDVKCKFNSRFEEKTMTTKLNPLRKRDSNETDSAMVVFP